MCWAMGLTQHKNSVPTIREVVNFLLLRGNVGRPGAGVCPVRGHSNVQGDRTMGIYENGPSTAFLDALAAEFSFEPPRQHGYDVVETIRAMRDGGSRVHRARRQLRRRHPRHRGHHGRARPLQAHRAHIDQTQPLARGDRPRDPLLPASAGPSAT